MGNSASDLGKKGWSRNERINREVALRGVAENVPLCAFNAGDLPLLTQLFSITGPLLSQEEIVRLETRITDYETPEQT